MPHPGTVSRITSTRAQRQSAFAVQQQRIVRASARRRSIIARAQAFLLAVALDHSLLTHGYHQPLPG